MYQQLLSVAALVAAVAASPVERRAGSCPTRGVATLAGTATTVTGPFKMTASLAPAATYTPPAGKYAQFGSETYENVVFTGRTSTASNEFYLNDAGNLLSVLDNVLYTGYQGFYNTQVHVQMDTTSTQPLVVCSIAASDCAVNCKIGNNATQCLASPHYQPDWSIIKKQPPRSNCVPFTPIAIAG